MKTLKLFLFIFSLLFIPLSVVKAEDLNSERAIIYYNEACGMCGKYVNDELPQMLSEQGINNLVKEDYVNDRSIRPQMNEYMDNANVPLQLQSHIMTFVGDKYILGGHIPEHIIKDIFNPEFSGQFKRIIVYQDLIHVDIEAYRVWAIPQYADDFVGEIKTYPIDTRVTEYLKYLENNKETLKSEQYSSNKFNNYKSLLPIVLISGFLDGINPCAFAVLLFFIAFLFSLKKTKRSIWKMGVVYISAIFLAYLLIGFGLFKAIIFTNSPHFMAKLGAWLVIVLGLINMIGYLFPKFPIKLRIPKVSIPTLKSWMFKATLPAAFVLGFLVGLCTFPCSGGIYVAIIGLLATQTTHWSGVGFLLLYNLMFVLPLVIMLMLTSNKHAVEKLAEWERSESSRMKILAALTMLALGAIILIFFT